MEGLPMQTVRRWLQIETAQMVRSQMVSAQIVRFYCSMYIRIFLFTFMLPLAFLGPMVTFGFKKKHNIRNIGKSKEQFRVDILQVRSAV